MRHFISAVLLALAAIVAGLGVWAFWIEPASLRIQEYETKLKNWPTACDGLSVAIVADIHAGAPHIGLDKVKKVVEITNAEKPDLILLLGDYVIHGVLGGKFIGPEKTAPILSKLRAPLGVFAILGNHDWWLDANRVAKAISINPITLLEDANVEIGLNDCKFHLVGISDFREGPHDIRKAMHGVPRRSPVIILTHDPDIFPHLPKQASLAIAGHTHGGQVNLPWFGRLKVPSQYGARFAAGMIVEGTQKYFVSPGIGTSILPVRFRVPPEVSLLKFRSQ